jgi:hypothetical protein
MVKVLDAVFDGEILRFEEPVELKPNTRVRVTIETIELPEATPLSFLQTARNLNLQGPADWAERLEDYLYAGEANGEA